MAWSAPATFTTGQVVTASDLNSDIRDNARYLKGLDGAVTVEDSLIIQTAAGKYLQVPSMTTANLPAAPANGMIAYDSTTNTFKRYENGAWISFPDLAKMTIASIAQGDVFYRGAADIERLAAGSAGYFLKTNGAGANPSWDILGAAVVTAPVSVGASSTDENNGPVVNVPTAAGVLHIMGTFRLDSGTLTLRFRDAALTLITAYGYQAQFNPGSPSLVPTTINGTSIVITAGGGGVSDYGFFHAFLKPAATGNHKLTSQFSASDADHNCTASAYWTI